MRVADEACARVITSPGAPAVAGVRVLHRIGLVAEGRLDTDSWRDRTNGRVVAVLHERCACRVVQRNEGGTRKKRYINERTTTNNEQRRTTLTMIIARQDSFRILGLIYRCSLESLFGRSRGE